MRVGDKCWMVSVDNNHQWTIIDPVTILSRTGHNFDVKISFSTSPTLNCDYRNIFDTVEQAIAECGKRNAVDRCRESENSLNFLEKENSMITAKEAKERAIKQPGIDLVESCLKDLDKRICEASSTGSLGLHNIDLHFVLNKTNRQIVINKLESLGFVFDSEKEKLSWSECTCCGFG